MRDSEPLLTTREVAELLGLSTSSVLRRYRNGDLPGYRLGSNVLRFRPSEIEAWIDECRSRPASATVTSLQLKRDSGAR